MATATLKSEEYFDVSSFQTRFALQYLAENWNDIFITLKGPEGLLRGGATRSVFVDQMSISVLGLAAGVTVGAPTIRSSLTTTTYLPSFASVLATDAHIYDLRKPCAPAATQSGTWIGMYYVSGYAATDDMYIDVWGWMDWTYPETPPDRVDPQPVDVKRLLGWPRV